MKRWGIPLIALLACGCTEEPTPKEAAKAVDEIQQDDVKSTQLSIEEAAEQATKLIEEEAKAGTDAAMSETDNK